MHHPTVRSLAAHRGTVAGRRRSLLHLLGLACPPRLACTAARRCRAGATGGGFTRSGGSSRASASGTETEYWAGSTAGQAQSSIAGSGPTAAGTNSGIAAREQIRSRVERLPLPRASGSPGGSTPTVIWTTSPTYSAPRAPGVGYGTTRHQTSLPALGERDRARAFDNRLTNAPRKTPLPAPHKRRRAALLGPSE